MYVAEITIATFGGERKVVRVEEPDNRLFYAKVTGTVGGLTMGGYAVVGLETREEGE